MQQANSQMPQSQVPFSPVPPPGTKYYPPPMPELGGPFNPGPQPQRSFSPSGPGSSMPQPQRSFSPPGSQMPQPEISGYTAPFPPMPAPPMPVPQSQAPLSPLPPMMQRSGSQGMGAQPAVHLTGRIPFQQSPYLQPQGPEGPVVPIMRSPGPEGVAAGNPVMPVIPPSLSRSSSSSSSSSATFDPLARNPLPDPPREANVPPELVRDTAVATLGPRGPVRSRTPLSHPLPELPRDVYLKKKYRPLLVGTTREKDVYPEGWFADEDGRNDAENGLARAFQRLNPFRSPEIRAEAEPMRFRALGRHATMPEFADFVRNGPPPMEGSVSGGSSSSSTRRWRRLNPFNLFSPLGRRRRAAAEAEAAAADTGAWAPPPGFMPHQTPLMPMAQDPVVPPFVPPGRSPVMPPLIAAQGPASPTPVASAPSPGAPPAVRFNLGIPEYAGLCHTSHHPVLYGEWLYPSAAHLFEALKFLGRRDDVVEQIRAADDLSELAAVVNDNQHHIRRDWGQVAMRKVHT